MSQVYVWFLGTQTVANRCAELQDKAGGQQVARAREDWHAFPAVQWGVAAGAGPDAAANVGAALVQGIRESVIAGTNEHLSPEEMTELQGYYTQATAQDDDWWWDEEGELLREV